MIALLTHIILLVQQAAADSVQDTPADEPVSTAFDSIWAGGEMPTQSSTALEQVMLADDKLFVVLAVVLIIWIGLITLLIRNDQRLKKLERTTEEIIPEEDHL